MDLPDLDTICPEVHKMWLQGKINDKIGSVKNAKGEELMVEWAGLSDYAKQAVRRKISIVYTAIRNSATAAKQVV